MNYSQQIQQVIDYIGAHLDESLSLERLSEISCMSKYHFHRLFTAMTGLSLHQYIRWLRLKRAAHQLLIDKKKSIILIAINAGFDSHEAFTRAFKKCCGATPSEFRERQDWLGWESLPYCLPNQSEKNMNVDIKEKKSIRLAVVEHRGDPIGVSESVNTLIRWAKAQPINLTPKPGDSFGIAYDDPKKTPKKDFRFDLGLRVPENYSLHDGVVEKSLPEGRYAVTMHKGSHERLGETVYSLYREWLPESGEELGDLPCVFCYHNFDHEVAETELLTECWLLLKNR